ncbi:spore germination protein [Natranaerovirga hydrolytica]|uniref:Spore germination protein n=1 Tax=Natranaerovirga hydrolytica TaxID=680378 RepID=A0A4R1MXS1_9FIRM|nr:glycosyl hydrolase family 18 protein [Natranaerovirga hydrolytica]TCK98067.1 spore germination protein [Natranaerovirga hydrolytica]
MQIYTVKQGDTLFDIAIDYDVNEDLLIDANRIENPENLVVGQTLVIPLWGSYYFVEPGDTLEIISGKTGVSIEQLRYLNQLTDLDSLEIGTRIYLPQEPRVVMDVTGYVDLDFTGEQTIPEIEKASEQLTFINIFTYKLNPNGTLSPLIDKEVVETAYGNIISPIMVITNFVDGQFSQELANIILSNEILQNTILQETLSIMDGKGYVGIEFNLEYLDAQSCEAYIEFLKKAVDLFKPLGYTVSIAIIPDYFKQLENLQYQCDDYETFGQIVDYINFMTYDLDLLGGPPRPVAPLDEVRKVMEYVTSIVPNNKIKMGIPLYGYHWELTDDPSNQARLISPQRAIEKAQQYGAEIKYAKEYESPFFAYTDEKDITHIVWFEDARSVQAKFDLAKELGLKGLNYWVIGVDFPQNWLLMEDNFIIRKPV